jgi:head-tail adaptor
VIRAGRHDQKLIFQRLTTASDAMGSVTETWANAITVWGMVQADRSVEGLQSGQRTGHQIFTVTVRADSKTRTITATDRLRWDGREFDLSPPRPVPAGRPERIEFTATGRSN